MPFSAERTALVKDRIKQRLASGQSNEWEVSFLFNMAKRFDRYGTKTRLSEAQYVQLHKVLNLDLEGTEAPRNRTNDRVVKPTPHRATKSYQPRVRPMSIIRAVSAPRRAIRRAQRQVMLPIVLFLGFFALIGSLFDSSTSNPSTSAPKVTSTPQANNVNYSYVTGTQVNQRAGPSTASAVMGVLDERTQVQRIRDQGGWTEIVSTLGTGWMSSGFLSSEGPTVAQPTSQGQTLRARDVRVIDGDTVDIRGQDANVRLVGFNAPETWKPSCSAEREVGQKATARLTALVKGAQSIEFRRVACSCRRGTEGTDQCNFGRQCGSLFVDGVDVGTTLIGERLAVPYRCGATSCPPRPQAWCR